MARTVRVLVAGLVVVGLLGSVLGGCKKPASDEGSSKAPAGGCTKFMKGDAKAGKAPGR